MHIKVAVNECYRRRKGLSVKDRDFIERRIYRNDADSKDHIGRVMQIHGDLKEAV